ncbi:hypothetical protein AGENTSMITH_10 [Bacillus phage vB_BspM_AgentSmith]|nr:hypothetical protein AGENTSMITH_10 [Bacillus phage vB_BspM_AgentSmith]
MSKKFNPEKKKLAKVVKSVVDNEEVIIDIEDDETFLANNPVDWNDLNKLKDDLGNTILNFVGQIKSTIENPQVVNNLGDRADEFKKLVTLFFSDISDFSSQVKTTRGEHEHRSGRITSLEDYNTYNRLAITYHNLYMELISLTSPTMSSIVMLISDITADMDIKAKKEAEEAIAETAEVIEVEANQENVKND